MTELRGQAVPTPPAPHRSWRERAAAIQADPDALGLELSPAMALRLRRELDRLEQRLLFGWMQQARADVVEADSALLSAETHLGPSEGWAPHFQRFLNHDRATLVLVLTWQCETRCSYCSIPKQDGREMSREVITQAIDLLQSADSPGLELRLFGGEPMMQWDQVQFAIETFTSQCAGRDLQVVITTNGHALTEERMTWLARFPVRVQVALDGLPEAHDLHRRAVEEGVSSYAHSAIDKAGAFERLALAHDVIMVVHPARIEHMADDFAHVVDRGFRRIQLNWAHNQMWRERDREAFARGLHRISAMLRERWALGEDLWVVNLEETLERVRVFREVTVDHTGEIFANNAFLYRPKVREPLRIGHLDEGHHFLHYLLEGPKDEALDELSFAPTVRENNARVGMVMNSWVRWMRSEGLPDRPPRRHPRAEEVRES
jgi:sulfatase maturation enzyme AslB (radical SAM superfamily)